MRIKRDIGKGQLCTRGGVDVVLLGIVGGGVPPVTFRFPSYFRPKHAIFDTFIRFRGSLGSHFQFQTIMVKVYIRFGTKTAQKAHFLGLHLPL